LDTFPGGYKNIRPFFEMYAKFSVIGQVSFRATRMSRVSPGLDTDEHDRRVIPANHTHGWSGQWTKVVGVGGSKQRNAAHIGKPRLQYVVSVKFAFFYLTL
jgi:hypothetical protein